MSQICPSSRCVVALRLSDTAVTPSDCWIENLMISEYERSAPSSVMSVPCSVVMTFGTDPPFEAARIWRARYPAVACGTA